MEKNKGQKKLFILLCGVLLLVLMFLVVWKVVVIYQERSAFDFDLISPQGEFTDLETAAPGQDDSSI